ncbi:uncharacterized protein [Labrus bergylta]|uniref:uncharacterized protein isoform X3 n=1 Tax=Labrus bergylta TaxID=56723 RepID=UPI00331377C1
MDEFKWIQISFILVTVLQLTAAVTGLSPLYYYVRVEDEVTLACGNVIEDQSDCDSTAWTWTSRSTKAAVELITLGQIADNTGFKSDRLSVAVNCALVIKKVTEEDAGYFVCQQYKSDRKAAPDAPVYLSVISSEVTTATIKSTTPNEKSKTETDTTETGVNDSSKLNAQWRLIVVSVGLSALILTVVMVNVWTKTQGQQTRMDENMVNGSHEDDDAVNYENISSPAEE